MSQGFIGKQIYSKNLPKLQLYSKNRAIFVRTSNVYDARDFWVFLGHWFHPFVSVVERTVGFPSILWLAGRLGLREFSFYQAFGGELMKGCLAIIHHYFYLWTSSISIWFSKLWSTNRSRNSFDWPGDTIITTLSPALFGNFQNLN